MKPYYEHAGITIYHGDSREVLSGFDSESVDLVLTDPPYNVGKYYGKGMNDNKPEGVFWADYHETFELIFPLMKQNTLIYVSSTTRQMYQIKPLLEVLGWRWLQTLIWYRPNMVNAAKSFAAPWSQLYEPITLLVKGKRPKMTNPGEKDGDEEAVKTHDVLIYASPQSNFHESVDHPTQKPIGLYGAIIGRSKGETVLDPFMGSGTTLLAAKNLGRKAIGIDIEEKYCEIAANRVTQEVMAI